MILYKYYDFEVGKIALESERVGFRCPKEFNDPFEVSVIKDESFTGDRIDEVSEGVAILSLTRTPFNPLMWAHYGDNHRGFVIGYEVEIPFFQCEASNLIPVQKGNVIYTKTKPYKKISRDLTANLCAAIEGVYDEQDTKIRELIGHLFLNKDTIWCYEEEVRIVKGTVNWAMEAQEFFKNPYNKYEDKKDIPGLKIYDHKIEIKEVYLGTRNQDVSDISTLEYLNKFREKGTKIYSIYVEKESWNLSGNLIKTE